MTKVTFSDLAAQENRRDPHSFYAALRAQERIVYVPDYAGENGAWIVTHYDDALALLKDPRLTKDPHKISPQQGEPALDNVMHILMQNMIMKDAPDHTRLRSLVSKVFTPRMIEQLRPRIQQITDELLDAALERSGGLAQGEMDLMQDFAFPLPVTVICEMLGFPEADRPDFYAWMKVLMDIQADEEARGVAMQELLRYIQAQIAEKRTHPDADLTSALLKAEEQGDTLSQNELVSMLYLLFIAGHETTANLIGGGTLTLLLHPEQLKLLRDDPALITSAVEELLRYTAPVSISDERWALEDFVLYGKQIHRGDLVYAALISANADPAQFHDPDALDILRKENPHLAFGKGIHYCLGAPLARLEGQIAFGTLLRRLPDLKLARDPETLVWKSIPMLHGLTSLPVTF